MFKLCNGVMRTGLKYALKKKQLKVLIDNAKNTSIYLHIPSAGFMELRREEIIGLINLVDLTIDDVIHFLVIRK